MTSPDRRHRPAIRRELEPHILPRQLQALERVADRLAAARPHPDGRFRAELHDRIEAIAGPDGDRPPAWVKPAMIAAGLGAALLAVAAGLAL